MPTPGQSDGEAIRRFIDERGVGSITHLADTSRLWGIFNARSLPSWATVSASGTVNTGGGGLPGSVVSGDWTD